MRSIIIEINGGIGKSILSTAVIRNIKLQYPEDNIIVITAYPEVFLNNPDIYRIFRFGSCPYFYNEYIKDKDVLFLCEEPYRSNGYLSQNKHLIESWCEVLNIKVQTLETRIYLNHRELMFSKNTIKHDKPIALFQPFGGAVNKNIPYSWNRDIPPSQAQEIVNILSKKYNVIQPVSGNQLKLKNCHHLTCNLRELFCHVYYSDRIISIDSCVQHAAKALNKHSTVCWITNKHKVFGYDSHYNVYPKKSSYKESQDIIDGYFLEHDFTGNRLYDFPFNDDNIFDINEVLTEPSFIDSYFDCTYVINLDRRTDRWDKVIKNLENSNIKKYKRISGVEINDDILNKIPEELYANFSNKNIKYIKGALGCKRSHLNCIEDAKYNNYKKILILEDDIVIDNKINETLINKELLINGNWDMLYFGGDYRQNNITFQTSSYALQSNMYDYILDNARSSGLEIDYYYINHIQNNFNVFRIAPPLIMQDKLDTDIQIQ
jgi:hypothetical protein